MARHITPAGAAVLALLLLALTAPGEKGGASPSPPGASRLASICVKTGEKISGATKTCFYNCAGAGSSMVVPATFICPMTVQH
jgi:hypothetical protein